MKRRDKANPLLEDELNTQRKQITESINIDMWVRDNLKAESLSLQETIDTLSKEKATLNTDVAICVSNKKLELQLLDELKAESNKIYHENNILEKAQKDIVSKIHILRQDYKKYALDIKTETEKIELNASLYMKDLCQSELDAINENENLNNIISKKQKEVISLDEQIDIKSEKSKNLENEEKRLIEAKEQYWKEVSGLINDKTINILEVEELEFKKDSILVELKLSWKSLDNSKKELEKVNKELLSAKELTIHLINKEEKLNKLSAKVTSLYEKAWITINL